MFNFIYRVRGHRSHELVLHLCFFSSVNWQGHEVWIHVLLLLVGQRWPGEGRPEGHGIHQCLTYSWVWWDDLHPVPGRVTAQMVPIQCVNPSVQAGMACGKFHLWGRGRRGVCSGNDKQAQKTWHPASSFQQL